MLQFLQTVTENLPVLLQVLPNTPPQRDRIQRAVNELPGYAWEDASGPFDPGTLKVQVISGSTYLVWENQCSCPDWGKRVLGSDQVCCCKHQIAAMLCGQLPLPGEEGESAYPSERLAEADDEERHARALADRDLLWQAA